ncbi:MAG TPA: GerMN domain-containing protein [Thermoanaerobaculia bacterium]|nr:GerMN domain-containing protein [Thermoanaerobaculia bacterium]
MPRAVSLVLFLFLLLRCTGNDPTPAADAQGPAPSRTPPPSTPRPSADPGAAPSPATRERNVTITIPTDGQTIVSNPIRVAGLARTFENHVEIRVDDPYGQPIATRYTTARGEMGEFNPFSDEIFLTTDPGSEIAITAIERSAEDGSIRTSHAVRVRIEARRIPLRLYFPNANRSAGDCSAVEPVVRDVPVTRSTARLALEALLRGPIQQEGVAGFTNPFPKGAAVRSVNLAKGTLTVDFNDAMGNVGGSCRVQAIRAAIEKTMTSIAGIERVVITAMGDEKTALQP